MHTFLLTKNITKAIWWTTKNSYLQHNLIYKLISFTQACDQRGNSNCKH